MRPIIVVPAFNEASTVPAVVAGARPLATVVVVDDGSSDATAAAAAGAGAEVLRPLRRLGKGQALRTGIAAARARGASVIVTLDADGQHDPAEVPALLRAAAESPRAIIVGDRLAAGGALPPGRLAAVQVAGFFVNWITGVALRDTQSGFRAYPTALFDEVRPRHGGFVFETEILVAAAARGFELRQVPVAVAARAAQRSRFRPLADGVAIGAYLAARTTTRWHQELVDAVLGLAAVFGRDRRIRRHTRILEDASVYGGGSAGGWAIACGASALRQCGEWLGGCWDSPRRRRALAAASACAASPCLLAAALVQALAPPIVPDVLTPLVRRLYDQERLDVAPRRSPAEARAVAEEPHPRSVRGEPLGAPRGGRA
jgi:hypothetical protein